MERVKRKECAKQFRGKKKLKKEKKYNKYKVTRYFPNPKFGRGHADVEQPPEPQLPHRPLSVQDFDPIKARAATCGCVALWKLLLWWKTCGHRKRLLCSSEVTPNSHLQNWKLWFGQETSQQIVPTLQTCGRWTTRITQRCCHPWKRVQDGQGKADRFLQNGKRSKD